MILLAKVAMGAVGVALAGGAVLCSQGFISIRVLEREPSGTKVNLVLPASLLPVTLKLVPRRYLREASENVSPYLPILEKAIPALEDCPDGVMVEVAETNDYVVIAKRHGSIVIDANDEDDVVHVSLPLVALNSAFHQLTQTKAGFIFAY
ncbi:MAG: hypothetical protein JO356_06050 [Acidobacteria bacterium]|nr:hypothetical protein [Acidobacteriota bacterium]